MLLRLEKKMENDFLEEGQQWPEPKVSRETVLTMATLVSAKYHPEERCLIVQVGLPDGSRRALPIFASTFSHFHGVPYKQAQKVLVDKEMFKTESLFNAAAKKGRRVKIKMYKEQMELDGLSFH